MTREISHGNFSAEKLCMYLCVLGSGVEGVGITPLYGVSRVWAGPKGMTFGLFIPEKVVNFRHIGLK